MNTSTGQLQVTQDLDFETQANFSFVVVCTDILGENSTAVVEVELSSVNEYSPVVTSMDTFQVLVPETTDVGTVIISSVPGGLKMFTVVDGDMGVDGVVNYTLVSAPDDHFTLDPVSGTLTLVQEVDFDTEVFSSIFLSMDVEIAACDRHTPLSACPQIDVLLYLIAENDNSPSFVQDLYTVDIIETAPINSTILTLECVDIDMGIGGVQSLDLLEPAPEVEAMFRLGPVGVNGSVYSSTLTVAGQLDYDRLNQSYLFQVSCNDGQNSSTATVGISILPRNDEVPMFQNNTASGYQLSVSQTAPPGTLVGSVSASDDDVGSGTLVTYTILSPTPFFTIDPLTGQITTSSSLTSITAMSTLLLNVTASDGEFSESVHVQVTITPGNFHAPSFVQSNQTLYLNELTMAGEIIANFTCSDNDTGPGGDITYSLTSENDMFTISSATGEVRVSGSLILPPGCAAVMEYRAAVQCEDHGTPSLSDQATLTVRVFQDDSVPPSLIMNNITAAVSEGAPNGTIITTILATDPDTVVLNFEIVNQTVPGTFTIENAGSQRGHLLLAAVLDYEQLTSYHLLVEVVEMREVPGEAQRVRGEVRVNVLDENDNSPQFTYIPPPVTASDATPPGLPIFSVQCSDSDTGSNAELQYSLAADDLFTIHPNNGTVSPTSSLTLTSGTFTSSHQLEVCCMDRGIPPLSNTTNVSITIYKSDTQPPVLRGALSANISEGAELGEELVTVQAFDEDSPGILYRLENESAPGVFTINETTGVVSLVEQIDRETVATYIFSVIAEEVRVAPGPAQFSSALVTVEVLDENDNRPQFTEPREVPLNVTDDVLLGMVLTTLPCQDADSGPNAELNYTLHGPVEATEDFRVNSSGSLTVARTLSLPDFVLMRDTVVTISCSDKGDPPLSSLENATVFIHIVKVDLRPPVINNTEFTVTVPENASLTVPFYTISAFDIDSPGILYSLETYGLAPFSIMADTPQLFLSAPLDREATPTYLITLIATELRTGGGSGRSTRANLTVLVGDINDNAPVLLDVSDPVTVSDATPPGLPIFSVQCSDSDAGSNAELQYSLAADDLFTIHPNNGTVSPTSSLTLTSGTFTSLHQLEVCCMDRGIPPLSNTTNVTITIYKSDTQPPVLPGALSANISEGAELGEELVTVQAFDEDSPGILYRLENESAPGVFTINETTGVVSLVELIDREAVATYIFSVIAEEVRVAPGPAQFSSALVTVEVLDENDNRPFFVASPHDVTVSDLTANGTTLTSVQCMDEDEGSNAQVEYSIVPTHSLFAVDSTGSVLVAKSLLLPDFTLSITHTISLQCMDLGMPRLTSREAVSLNVTITKADVAPPQVHQSNASVSLPEDSANGTIAATIAAFDVDSPAVALAILNQTIPGTFSVLPSSPFNHPDFPQLVLSGSLDRETTSTHTITILATAVPADPTTPPQNVSLSITVEVEDVNDNAPVCSVHEQTQIRAGFYRYIPLFNLSCTDADLGPNQQLVYQLDNTSLPRLPDGSFTINHTSAEVGLEGGIAAGSYVVCVVVSDLGTPQLRSMACVDVVVTEGEEGGEGVPVYLIVAPVAAVLLLLGLVAVGGLCCCYWCKIRGMERRKKYLIR